MTRSSDEDVIGCSVESWRGRERDGRGWLWELYRVDRVDRVEIGRTDAKEGKAVAG
jgi:hypothetical protein